MRIRHPEPATAGRFLKLLTSGFASSPRMTDCCAAASQFCFGAVTTDLALGWEKIGSRRMAVLDHDHEMSPDKAPAGGVGQFCFFWVGVFAVIALLGFLFKG